MVGKFAGELYRTLVRDLAFRNNISLGSRPSVKLVLLQIQLVRKIDWHHVESTQSVFRRSKHYALQVTISMDRRAYGDPLSPVSSSKWTWMLKCQMTPPKEQLTMDRTGQMRPVRPIAATVLLKKMKAAHR